MPHVRFPELVEAVKAAATAKPYQSVLDGLQHKPHLYSLRDDDKLDSLDKVEMVMASEEHIDKLYGDRNPEFRGFSIDDAIVEKSKNLGDLYKGACEKYEMEVMEFPSD